MSISNDMLWSDPDDQTKKVSEDVIKGWTIGEFNLISLEELKVKTSVLCVLCGLLFVIGCSNGSHRLLVEAVRVVEKEMKQEVPPDQRSHAEFCALSQKVDERMAKKLEVLLDRHPDAPSKDRKLVKKWIDVFRQEAEVFGQAAKMSEAEFEKSDLPERLGTLETRFLAIGSQVPESVLEKASKSRE